MYIPTSIIGLSLGRRCPKRNNVSQALCHDWFSLMESEWKWLSSHWQGYLCECCISRSQTLILPNHWHSGIHLLKPPALHELIKSMLSKEQNTRNIIETGRVQESDYRAALVCRCGGRRLERWFGTTSTRHEVWTLSNGDPLRQGRSRGNHTSFKTSKGLPFPLEIQVGRIPNHR